ncbi:MAG TPA: DUF6464 family protein [Thermosynechococcaceae cyanobacterium]
MVETVLILTIALVPGLLSLLGVRRESARAQRRLRAAMSAATAQSFQQLHYSLNADYEYLEGQGYLLGDITCRFNARSPHLRCAVNPSGSCKECPHYEIR